MQETKRIIFGVLQYFLLKLLSDYGNKAANSRIRQLSDFAHIFAKEHLRVCRICVSIFEIDRKRKSIGKGGKRVIVVEGVFSIQKLKINKEGETP